MSVIISPTNKPGCRACHELHEVNAGIQPGTLLAMIIHEITNKSVVGCSACSERARQMNKWGWLGCWQNRDTIIQWLMEEAHKLGHEGNHQSISKRVMAAILTRVNPF
jgi:hypothetical protein